MPTINAAFNSLEPRFKPIVLEVLKQLEAQGFQPIVAEGRRTVSQQREKVRLGYSHTMNSYHLTGMAADIVDKRYMWNVPLSHAYWIAQGKVVESMKASNPGLRWGGTWASPYQRFVDYLAGRTKYFVDVAHVELRR